MRNLEKKALVATLLVCAISSAFAKDISESII